MTTQKVFTQVHKGVFDDDMMSVMPESLRATYNHLANHRRTCAVPGLAQASIVELARNSGIKPLAFSRKLSRLCDLGFVLWNRTLGTVFVWPHAYFVTRPGSGGWGIKVQNETQVAHCPVIRAEAERAMEAFCSLKTEFCYRPSFSTPGGRVPPPPPHAYLISDTDIKESDARDAPAPEPVYAAVRQSAAPAPVPAARAPEPDGTHVPLAEQRAEQPGRRPARYYPKQAEPQPRTESRGQVYVADTPKTRSPEDLQKLRGLMTLVANSSAMPEGRQRKSLDVKTSTPHPSLGEKHAAHR